MIKSGVLLYRVDDTDHPSITKMSPELNNEFESTLEERTRCTWRNVDGVCFDFDSTVCQDEAIDELAAFVGVGPQVAACTKKAMNGGYSFRKALTERLKLIKPTTQQIATFMKEEPPKLTPGFKDLLTELNRRRVKVFIVSGGFNCVILPVAKELDIPQDHVFANVLQFDDQGCYTGFDASQPTSDSDGKAKVCALLKRKYNLHNLVMVGDGATDMEACPPADAFIGFGGNQAREVVRSGAGWFVLSFADLTCELQRSNTILRDN